MSQEELDYEEDQDHLNEPKRQVAIRGEAKNVRLRHRECDICFHIYQPKETHHSNPSTMNREVMYAELLNGLLRELARALGTSFPVGFEEKLNAIMRIRTQLPPTEFHISEVKLVDAFLKLNCLEPASNYKIPATPLLKIHHILHWKILKNLIDQLCRQMGSGAFQDLDDLGSQSTYKTELKYAIANFVFPSAWPNSAQRSEFRKDNRLRFTFGIHPKIISSSSTSSLEHNWTDLQNLLKSTKTVAVGEIGLDDSTNPSRRDFERQIKYFRKQLYLATELNLTVVIHSRGRPSLHETRFGHIK
ncbi:tatD [Mytilus coruscus]|uniref:TatD n=1 Tax=Mytilus coruscus TaxID=42192 RepID=A0A6J8E3U8_MYTCO|nr:tatD [Mytilus coruscus]